MILVYFISIIIIGCVFSKSKDLNDYLFCSRKVTLPSLVATLVTTWYGGILEIGRFTYENGLVTWIIFGLFYYLAAFLYAFFIVPKIRFINTSTIPQLFDKHYGKLSKLISATIMILLSSPAPYIMILSTIISHLYKIDIFYSIIIATATSIIYIYIGGFRSIIRTDKIQFIFMFSGFIIMLFYLIKKYGGIEFLLNNVPTKNLSVTGDFSISYILSWIVIAFITMIDPSIFQRTYSGKSLKVVQRGLYISIIFWFIFDFLTITTGLYASAIIQSLNVNPFLYLSDTILPPIAKNVFYISIISVVMSTIDSFTFISAFTIGKDILNKNSIKNIRIGLILTSIVSVIIVYSFEEVVHIWYMFGSIAASSILIPFLLILFKPETKISYPEFCLITPILINFIWIFIGYPFNIDSIYPGITSSLIITYIFIK